ncbi:MAG: branched-chain amino acid ABC transporter permease, partial [Alphaproteobacteria bacterium]
MDYIYSVIILISLFVVLATSFNLVIGYGGLISIAHPIFYGLGAYTSALLARDAGLPVPVAMLAGAGLATAMSVVLSLPALRISGDYLLIASIGFQLGMIELIKNLRFTGGASGVSNIPAFLVPSYGRFAYVALVICVAVAVVLLVRWIAHSDYGRAISAMRDDEVAFAALGRDAKWMKISIFALGSGIAGFAGALYAHYFRYVTVEQFEILMSSTILTMVVVGGLRSPWGPVVGAVLLQILPQAITFLNLPPVLLGPLQGLLFTGLVLVFMFVRPGGLIQAGTTWTSSAHT